MVRGVVYAGSDTGFVHALDAENGELLWSSTVQSAVQSSPVVIDGKVYVSTEYGFVYVLLASG
ncbi:MAG: PQQ-binding-like beta-propeller repeat protein [Chloroflexi bacterium]|nr:PQQ-binding-like beta-propeller repeat protein [Chloroflexota bacterium]